MIREGQRVAYAGEGILGLDVGTEGKVLAVSGLCAHVQWAKGARAGQVDLVEEHELVPHTATLANTDTFANSLEISAMPVTAAIRETYDAFGEDGLVNALAESGHLAVLNEYVEEAVVLIASRIRTDPSFSGVLSHFDSDESNSVVGKVATMLLTDRLSEEDS